MSAAGSPAWPKSPTSRTTPTITLRRDAVLLAFDFGTRRIGVASGNTITGTATALSVLREQGDAVFAAIAALIREWQPQALVVGVPRHPDGTAHTMTQRAERFARQLEARFGLPVAHVDERYSSVEAARLGDDARALDARSAAVILTQYLQARERACEGDRDLAGEPQRPHGSRTP
jgi:putative holliday junction resolvase